MPAGCIQPWVVCGDKPLFFWVAYWHWTFLNEDPHVVRTCENNMSRQTELIKSNDTNIKSSLLGSDTSWTGNEDSMIIKNAKAHIDTANGVSDDFQEFAIAILSCSNEVVGWKLAMSTILSCLRFFWWDGCQVSTPTKTDSSHLQTTAVSWPFPAMLVGKSLFLRCQGWGKMLLINGYLSGKKSLHE